MREVRELAVDEVGARPGELVAREAGERHGEEPVEGAVHEVDATPARAGEASHAVRERVKHPRDGRERRVGRFLGEAREQGEGGAVREAGQQLPGGLLPLAVPEDGDLAAPGLEADAERLLDGPEILVGDSEEGGQPGFRQGDRVAGIRNRRSSLRS